MADRQRKVSLIFEANTNQAKQNINDLVQSLQKIQSMPSSLIDPTGIKEASKAAMELQGHIQKAINIDTGKLDLSRFAASLSTSGKSLEQYRATLTRIGPEGAAAFKSVISSINNAEVSTVRLTKGMKDFLVTMKNTVKWQISSSIMHGLIGGMESAYGYAKSLDASLNNIRIVTGQTSDQMARFAVEANRAAQALSTTTTKYTDAALIFYQQGLNDKVVKERTDTVIKMANVTGETAKDVSSYMTAIWNNFADGSKSLEYYADVITKLGAATAASSEEIAGGLEKFAAIGNTIGLSYEYATSMITTIVDKTRQSEDVVGTALKTILARIQGLNLGETLDDGTTLNKYSGALEKVGINIKDASGQLKDMDIILDELGSKWNTFSKDTQIALAQVVGGVRQYNQIIALMDNWSSFQKNVQIAETSAGSLNEQANIYAEGWEAARDRVRAAAEGIYDALINEDVFIKLDNIFTGLLNGISGIVKGMGGMVPILGTIGGIITQKFAKEMPVALNNMKQNLMVLSGQADKEALQTQRKATVSAERMRDLSAGDARTEAEYESLRRISLMREKLIENQHRMSSAEIEQYQTIIKNEEALGRIMVERQATVGLIEKETQALKEQVALRTTQIQIENAKHDFTDDGSDEEYKTSKVWDTTQALERQKLEKQLLNDENRRSELMKAQLGEGKTKKEREKTRRALTSEEKIELQDIERRLNKYGIEGQRTDEYYNEIYARTSRKYKGMAKEAATKVVDAASIKKQKQLMTQEFKSLLNGEQFSGAENKVEILKQKFLDLKNSLGLIGTEGEQQFKDIEQIIVGVGDKADLTEDDIKKISKALDDVTVSAQNVEDQAKDTFKSFGGSEDDTAELVKSGEAMGAHQFSADLPKELPEPKVEDFSSKVAIATEALGSLMSAYGAVNAVIETWNTLTDENATVIEKIGAGIGALVSITMTLNSATQLATSLKLKDILVTYAGIDAEAKDITMKVLLTKVTKTLGAQIKQLWSDMGPLGWAILAVVAAVTALTAAMAYFNNQGTSTEKKIKELKEHSEGLAAAQENLKQSISDIESAWDNYQKMVDILNSCTTGTEEWNKALRDTNQAILEIIKTEPALAQFIQYDANGQAYLGGADYERYIAEKNRMSQLLQAEKTLVDADLSDLQNQKYLFGSQEQQVALTEFWKNNGNIQDWNTKTSGNLSKLLNDVFEGNEEEFKRYLDTSNLTQALETNEFLSINSDDIYKYVENGTIGFHIKDGAEVNTLQSEWLNALNTQSYNEQVRKIAYTDIFSNMAGYNADNIYLYSQELEKLIETEKGNIAKLGINDILRQYENYAGYQPNELSIKDGKIIDSAGNEIQGLTEASMRASVALGNVSRNSEALVGIIAKENAALEKMSPYAQFIVKAGNAVDSSIPIFSTTFKAQEANAMEKEAIDATIQANIDKLLTQRTANSTALESIDYSDGIEEISKIIANYFNITFEEAKSSVEAQLSDTGTVDIGKITASFETVEDVYEGWYESMLNLFGAYEWNNFIENSISQGKLSQGASLKDIYDYVTGTEGILEALNKDAIEAPEIIIGTSTEDYNRESILNLFYPDNEESQNIYRGKDGVQKFLEEFGEYYFSEEELEKLKIDWTLIAERIEKSIITNQENVFNEWQKGSSRFNQAVSYREETGFTVNEGKTGSQLFTTLQETGQLTANNINSFMNSFAEISGGMTDNVLVEFEHALASLIQETGNAEGVFQALDMAIGRAISSGKDLKKSDLVEIFKSLGIDAETLGLDLSDLNSTINTAAGSIRKFSASIDGLISTLKAGKTATDKLKKGEEISTEDYQNIVGDLTDEQKQLFVRSLNGYVFYGEKSDATAIASQVHDAGWQSYREGANRIQEAGEKTDLADIDNPTEMTRQDYIEYFLNNKDGYRDLAIASGIGEFNFNEIVKSLNSIRGIKYDASIGSFVDKSTEQNQAPLIASINDLITTMGNFVQGNYAEGSLESQQIAMTSATSTEELERRVSEGQIIIGEGGAPKEQYDAVYNQLQLDEYEADFGLNREEVDELGDSIQEMAESSDELADSLKNDEIAADKLAKAFKREEKAIDNINSSYENWIAIAKNKNRSEKETNKLAEETSENLQDLMDLSKDYFNLANKEDLGYLTDPKTIELMNDVANEVEGSQEAMMDSILEFKGEALKQSPEVIEAFKTMSDEMRNIAAGEEIKIGDAASVSPALQSALDTAIASLYDANGKLAVGTAEANEILSTMGEGAGFNIEAVTADTAVKGQTYYVPTINYPSVMEAFMGGSFSPTVSWEPVTGGDTDFPNIAYKVTNKKGSYGGGVSKGSRGGGGGGRGGGGGSRRPTAEAKKEPDKERYHTITNQLEDLTDAYDKVSKAADRAFGKSRIKLLQDQRKELQKLAAAQQSYIDEINDYYQQDLSNLDQVSAYVGFNIQLDENGTIANFDEIQNRMWEEYNSHINEKGEVIDMDEEAWKKYEEEWERIMALIEQYEETQDLRKEALQQLQDYINEIYDLQLEEVTYSVEIDIDASEYALEILDYLLKQVEDDAWSAAEAIAYMGEQATDFLHQSQTYNSGVADILRNHTRDITDSNGRVLKEATLTETDIQGYLNGNQASADKIRELGLRGEFTDEEIQSLKDYHSQLLAINQSLIDLRDQVYDTLSDSFSKFNEELKDTIDIMEHLTNITNSYRNIIDLVGKKNIDISNALLESFSQIQTNQAVDLVKAQKSRLDDLTTMRDEAEALRQKMLAEGNEKDAKEIEERIKEMNKQIREATEDYTSALENALQKAEDQFKLHIDNIIEDANQAFAGAMANIQQLQDMFNLKNDTNDIYLEDFEKIYELNKLNRDITNSIDETSNIKAKEELAKLQAEINALEEDGVKVSQYQTEDLRRRYELKLAEIALNEAQDAKSQVQMTRDADGNWSYIYTADENQVAEAEQNYEDKLYELQRANAEYINEMQDLLIQTETELMAKIEEITNDQTLSLEEKQTLIDEFTAQYVEKFNGYAGELNLVLDNNKLLYEDEWTAYSNLTGYKISADENYVDSFNETMLSTLTGFQTAEEFHQNFNDITNMLLNESDVAFEEWEDNVDEVFNAAGLSSEDLAVTLEEQFNNISNESENLAEDIKNTGDEAVEAFNDITEAVDNWYNQYSATIDRVLAQNTALAESFRTLLSAWSDYQAGSGIDDSGDNTSDEPPTDGENPADEGTDVQDSVAEKTEKYKKAIAFAIWSHPNSGWGHGNSSKNLTSGDRYDRLKAKGLDPNTVQQQINAYRGKSTEYMKKDSGIDFNNWGDRVKALDPYTYKKFAFDTGGYTGSWGDEGRWALLHEKEIVLNKEDTSNLLSAISMIRQISEVIDLNAYSSAGFGSGIGAAASVGSTGTLEQVVHVTAEFPNATNKDEIYAAFGEIVNLASQYANRR